MYGCEADAPMRTKARGQDRQTSHRGPTRSAMARTRMAPTPSIPVMGTTCLLYTSDAADERSSVDLGGRRIIKKKKQEK